MALGRPFKLSAARPPKGKLRAAATGTCLPESTLLMNCWKKNDFADPPCAQFVAKLAECMAKGLAGSKGGHPPAVKP